MSSSSTKLINLLDVSTPSSDTKVMTRPPSASHSNSMSGSLLPILTYEERQEIKRASSKASIVSDAVSIASADKNDLLAAVQQDAGSNDRSFTTSRPVSQSSSVKSYRSIIASSSSERLNGLSTSNKPTTADEIVTVSKQQPIKMFTSLDDQLAHIGAINNIRTHTSNRSRDLVSAISVHAYQLISEMAAIKIQCIWRGFSVRERMHMKQIENLWLNQFVGLYAYRLIDEISIEESMLVSSKEAKIHNDFIQYSNVRESYQHVLADTIIGEVVRSISTLITPYTIKETADEYIRAMKSANKSSNPIVNVINMLFVEEILSMVRLIVKLAIKECIDEYLRDKHADQIFNRVSAELVQEMLPRLAPQLLDEYELDDTACDIINEVADVYISDIAYSASLEETVDKLATQRKLDMNGIGMALGKMMIRTLVTGHMMMSISDNFNRTLIKYHIKGIVRRLIAARLIAIINRDEKNKRALKKSAIVTSIAGNVLYPVIRFKLLHEYTDKSEEVLQMMDVIESDYHGLL